MLKKIFFGNLNDIFEASFESTLDKQVLARANHSSGLTARPDARAAGVGVAPGRLEPRLLGLLQLLLLMRQGWQGASGRLGTAHLARGTGNHVPSDPAGIQ